MSNWFDTWFKKNVKKAIKMLRNEPNDEEYYNGPDKCISEGTIGENPRLYADHIIFSLFKADGGYVIQYQRSYNHSKIVSNEPSLTLCTNEEDLGEKISQIMVTQALRS